MPGPSMAIAPLAANSRIPFIWPPLETASPASPTVAFMTTYANARTMLASTNIS